MVAAFEQNLRVLLLPTTDRPSIVAALDELEKVPVRALLGLSEKNRLEQEVRAYGKNAMRVEASLGRRPSDQGLRARRDDPAGRGAAPRARDHRLGRAGARARAAVDRRPGAPGGRPGGGRRAQGGGARDRRNPGLSGAGSLRRPRPAARGSGEADLLRHQSRPDPRSAGPGAAARLRADGPGRAERPGGLLHGVARWRAAAREQRGVRVVPGPPPRGCCRATRGWSKPLRASRASRGRRAEPRSPSAPISTAASTAVTADGDAAYSLGFTTECRGRREGPQDRSAGAAGRTRGASPRELPAALGPAAGGSGARRRRDLRPGRESARDRLAARPRQGRGQEAVGPIRTARGRHSAALRHARPGGRAAPRQGVGAGGDPGRARPHARELRRDRPDRRAREQMARAMDELLVPPRRDAPRARTPAGRGRRCRRSLGTAVDRPSRRSRFPARNERQRSAKARGPDVPGLAGLGGRRCTFRKIEPRRIATLLLLRPCLRERTAALARRRRSRRRRNRHGGVRRARRRRGGERRRRR